MGDEGLEKIEIAAGGNTTVNGTAVEPVAGGGAKVLLPSQAAGGETVAPAEMGNVATRDALLAAPVSGAAAPASAAPAPLVGVAGAPRPMHASSSVQQSGLEVTGKCDSAGGRSRQDALSGYAWAHYS